MCLNRNLKYKYINNLINRLYPTSYNDYQYNFKSEFMFSLLKNYLIDY